MNTQLLDELVNRLREALGSSLVNVTLYGSAATGDYQEKVSDFNVLCVLDAVGREQLEAAYPAVDWWLKKRQPAPVLLSREEIANGHDAFAIEFLDIRQAYRTLHGEDLVAAIEIEPAHHRHQVEHELRSRLLRLRERYLALQKDRKQTTQLMVDSLPTFATLLRHALMLEGEPATMKKSEVFRAAAERLGLSVEPFETLLAVRDGSRRLSEPEIRSVFESYLNQITKAAEHVDRLDAAAENESARKES